MDELANSTLVARDLSPSSMEALRGELFQPFTFRHLECCRILDHTWRDIAYTSSRWTHHDWFNQDGKTFDIWLNWDGRAEIRCSGIIVMRFWAPAAEVFRRIKDRNAAAGAR